MEACVELVCPVCQKYWEASPAELPDPNESFTCPDCGERRALAEFPRTARDLDIVKNAVS